MTTSSDTSMAEAKIEKRRSTAPAEPARDDRGGVREDASLPLSGVRVLDLTRYLSGPYATLLLAEMGAEVIKVEVPEAGDDTRHIAPLQGDVSFYHSTINRSKASVELDLKSEEGRRLVHAMVADSDVFIQNFRTGVAERLGFGYDVLSKINPGLVYCSISGFGGTGPESRRAAFDLIVQAESGVMSLNGEGDSPPSKLGLPVADLTSGMFGVHGILAALLRRSRTGKGGLVEVSMMSSLLSLSVYNATRYFVTGETPKRMGSRIRAWCRTASMRRQMETSCFPPSATDRGRRSSMPWTAPSLRKIRDS